MPSVEKLKSLVDVHTFASRCVLSIKFKIMKYSLHLILLITMTIFIACSDDDSFAPEEPKTENLNLKSLAEGQLAKYVRLDGICGFDEHYNYSGDTILLDVVDIQGQLHFRESFTEGSPLYASNPSPVFYRVETYEDFILIPHRDQSTLFFFYGNDTIRTSPQHAFELEQAGCQNLHDGTPFQGDAIAKLPSWELHDINLNDQTVVSCVPVIFELEAYLMYNEGQLNLSYTLSSGFPGITFQGWKLLDN